MPELQFLKNADFSQSSLKVTQFSKLSHFFFLFKNPFLASVLMVPPSSVSIKHN